MFSICQTFGETFIDDDYFMAMAFSVGSIANALARIGWGFLTDRTSFQVAYLCFHSFYETLLSAFTSIDLIVDCDMLGHTASPHNAAHGAARTLRLLLMGESSAVSTYHIPSNVVVAPLYCATANCNTADLRIIINPRGR